MMDEQKDNILFEDKRTLKDIVEEVAKEEGLTYEETLELFKKGLREANNKPKVNAKKKAKIRAKNKQARKSRKKNRKR